MCKIFLNLKKNENLFFTFFAAKLIKKKKKLLIFFFLNNISLPGVRNQYEDLGT